MGWATGFGALRGTACPLRVGHSPHQCFLGRIDKRGSLQIHVAHSDKKHGVGDGI